MEPHSEELAERFEEALDRMGAYLMGASPLHDAATQLARRLSEMGIDYAIAGALALAAHGLVRATEDATCSSAGRGWSASSRAGWEGVTWRSALAARLSGTR